MQEIKLGKSFQYVNDDGIQIAIYTPEYFFRRKKKPEIIRFNSEIFDSKNHNISEPYIVRALPQYTKDIQTILQMYPDALMYE